MMETSTTRCGTWALARAWRRMPRVASTGSQQRSVATAFGAPLCLERTNLDVKTPTVCKMALSVDSEGEYPSHAAWDSSVQVSLGVCRCNASQCQRQLPRQLRRLPQRLFQQQLRPLQRLYQRPSSASSMMASVVPMGSHLRLRDAAWVSAWMCLAPRRCAAMPVWTVA